MYAESDRPHAIVIKVVVVHSDEDDSHSDPRIITNDDVTRMWCRIYGSHRIHLQLAICIALHCMQYLSALHNKWPLNRRDRSFTSNLDKVFT